jgi:hypothetical protein
MAETHGVSSTQRAVASDTAEGTENTTMLAQMEEVIKQWLIRVEENASRLTFHLKSGRRMLAHHGHLWLRGSFDITQIIDHKFK